MEPVHQPGRRVVLTPRSEQLCATAGVAPELLRAAEEECLVLACVSAPDASLAASWLLRHYDSDRDMDVKARVKRVLRGVLCVPEEGAARYVTRRPSLRKAS